ncbi:MAG: hypothetical protein R3253_07255 [Longimicrobiales bacterium]|nr:hypothetical protein [Longimicrobiales bacterium]
MFRLTTTLVTAFVGVTLLPLPAEAQDWTRREYPLAPPNASGNFVAPYFDGFYQNPDGTYTLSFGFMNRNDEDLIEIPLGVNNRIEPAEYDGVQPTTFPVVRYSGFGGPRERGAFGVVVPADFEGDVWWTLRTDGYETKVPGRLESPGPLIKGAYELSTGTMAAGSMRPAIQFEEDGEKAWGIEGVWHPRTFTTTVGEPVEIHFWAYDRGERELGNVNMTLWKYQGPIGAEIDFESLTAAPADAPRVRGSARPHGPGPVETRDVVVLPTEGPDANQGRFTATFDTPGRYVIRIRIDNFAAPDSMPGQQCCWSNGYVVVEVEGQ